MEPPGMRLGYEEINRTTAKVTNLFCFHADASE
jgi:hypothetical protein